MSTRYTPGPWVQSGRFITDTAGRKLCETFQSGAMTPSEQEANKRLMAVAPELVEAMGRLLSVLELAWSKQDLMIPEVREARAAIAKATGGQS